jgi:superfamily I DNA and/or RNA helicase
LLREGNWDAVVIDEASMAIPPILFLAARLARQRVVVIGDHNQLPPVVHSQDPVARQWLLRDVFDLAGVPEAIEDEDPPHCTVMLTRQFRMAAQIARLHNEVFYAGRLNTDDAPELRDPPLGCESLLYVNSGRLIPRSRTGSRRNSGHVEIIAALVQRIEHRARGVPTLILSPFRSQVRAIREVLGRRRAIDIGTIHSCQGSEAGIVVLDLTEGWGCRQMLFLSRDEPRWMGNRLLNVAISRAEQHLILLADFDYFEDGYDRAGTYTWNLLQWFRTHGLEINPHALLRRRAA